VEIPHIRGEEEEFPSNPIIEELLTPTHNGYYFKSMTPCASPQSEITIEDLSNHL
jgi:hypothetical protein